MMRIVSINILTILGLALTLELASRLFGHVSFPDPLIAQTKADWGVTRLYDPDLFWKLTPNTRLNRQVTTNSLGLRGPEIEAKKANEFRILSLGESTTFGLQLPIEATYSFRLEQLMGPVEGGTVRVINAGVPGYSIFQGLAYLRCCGLALKPDAVLLYFGFNDFLPISYRVDRDAGAEARQGLLTDIQLFEQRQQPLYRATHTLATYSNFARFLLFRVSSDATSSSRSSSQPRVPLEDRRRILTELLALANEHALRLIVIVPWYLEFSGHEALLREFAAAHDLVLVDIPRHVSPRADYFIDPFHPNAAGHEIIARLIAEEISRPQ